VDVISKDVLDMINREYQNHALQKINMIKLIKDCNQKMIKQMDEIKIPSLEDYLSKRYAFSTSKFTCKYCSFVGKNQGSLSSHLRGCAVRKTMDGEIDSNEEDFVEENKTENIVVTQSIPTIEKPTIEIPTIEKPTKETKQKKTKITIST
jgi:hypothetical protein